LKPGIGGCPLQPFLSLQGKREEMRTLVVSLDVRSGLRERGKNGNCPSIGRQKKRTVASAEGSSAALPSWPAQKKKGERGPSWPVLAERRSNGRRKKRQPASACEPIVGGGGGGSFSNEGCPFHRGQGNHRLSYEKERKEGKRCELPLPGD